MSAQRIADAENLFGCKSTSRTEGLAVLLSIRLDEFDTAETNDANYIPPHSDRPLLDNNESDILRSFFENPPTNFDSSNIQGSALLNFAGDFHPGNSETYTQASFGRSNAAASESANTPTMLHGATQMPNTDKAHLKGYSHFAPPHGQYLQDEYAAAKVLAGHHGSIVSQRGVWTGPGDGITAPNPLSGPPLFGSMPSGASNAYRYPSGNANSVPGQGPPSNGAAMNHGGAQSTNRATQNSMLLNAKGLPVNLNFGSDEKFRISNYAALPDDQLPDKQLSDVLERHLEYNHRLRNGSLTPSPPRSSESHSRKRPHLKIARISGACNAEEYSSSDDQSRGKRRRKSRRSDDGHEGENASASIKARRAANKTSTRKKSVTRKDFHPAEVDDRERGSSLDASGAIRENLTEEQKRNNHIQSEQKRRNLIKDGFEDLHKMVPELRSGGFSKSNMLVEAVAFMRKLRDDNESLRKHIRSLDNG